MKRLFLYLIVSFGIIFLQPIYAQEIQSDSIPPTDDLGNVSDAFQENFFEALKQKGIENYELAIEALRKAEISAKEDSEQMAVVNFEMGKNLAHLKRYDEAELRFKKVPENEGNRLDVLKAMYDLYYLKTDYNSAIPLVKELIKFDEDYKEDLVTLLSITEQYDDALDLLDELDEEWGESDYRDGLRAQIYRKTGNYSIAVDKLHEKIDGNPKNEKDYLNLIFLYSEQGNTEKAYETALELLKNNPESKMVHLALYKFYIEQGDASKALNSMGIVLSSSEVENDAKYRVLGDFIGFVNEHPEYENELESVVSSFSEVGNGKVYEDLGNFYLSRGDKAKALVFYEKGTLRDDDNFSLIRNTLLLQIDAKKYDAATKLSTKALDIFPAQPILYLANGVANINLNNIDDAIDSLELGLDFLFDDKKMEKDYYEQLSIAYTMKGDAIKAKIFTDKASEINLSN